MPVNRQARGQGGEVLGLLEKGLGAPSSDRRDRRPGGYDCATRHWKWSAGGDGQFQRLKLGLFGANCSSGRAVTKVPERWSGSWPDCLRLAQMADGAGIEFMLPVGRWKGYGGDTDYQGETFETVTWACGLLAATERMTVFGTVHAPLIHPLIAAKQFVTADHIGNGRFGLNVVCGWNEDEFDMFGATCATTRPATSTPRNGWMSSSWPGRRRRNSTSTAIHQAEARARQAETVWRHGRSS